MLFMRRIMTLLLVVAGGVFCSQAPELAQQYRQRLGGAIDELTIRIQDFDAHANHAGLDRMAALNIYARSPESFIRSQGTSMRQAFLRHDALSQQLEELAAASPVLRPFIVAKRPDLPILANAWRDFVPAVPVSVAGAVWAATGAGLGLIIAIMLIVIARAATRPMRMPLRHIQPSSSQRLR